MPVALIVLIGLGVTSLAVAAYTYLSERSRRNIVARATGSAGSVADPLSMSRSRVPAWVTHVAAIVPDRWAANTKTETQLVQAGYDEPTAPLVFAAIRIVALIGLPLLIGFVIPQATFGNYVFYLAATAIVAAILPVLFLIRAVRQRQEGIRRSLPDALDLLVVCIEAGISLDAAILRVAKDLGTAHPVLAGELYIVNRKTNVGMPRADALHGLWTRTGVEEVRILITHIVQGEKWGTSSGRVLRTYAETLRRQRRQAAEKKAATAPVKMLLPLGVFIFPALLLVVLGPVILNVITLFKP
jgi:tight adherence protein C